MKYVSAVLTFVLLSLAMVACQTDPVPAGAPQDLPDVPPPAFSDSLLTESSLTVNSTAVQPSSQNDSLTPQQTCYYPSTYYGYTGCMGYELDTASWYYVWPYGYGYSYCYVLFWTGSYWDGWYYVYDPVACNY